MKIIMLKTFWKKQYHNKMMIEYYIRNELISVSIR